MHHIDKSNAAATEINGENKNKRRHLPSLFTSKLNNEAAAAAMTKLCRRLVRWRLIERISFVRHFFRFIWDRVFACSSARTPKKYRRFSHRSPPAATDGGSSPEYPTTSGGFDSDSDFDSAELVPLKISLLGDCQIGKTSFVVKYVGDEQERNSLQMSGINLMNKTLSIQNALISFSIWDVKGDSSSQDQLPLACKDAVAILFMFDLTSRRTLNSIVDWYTEARKWNQTAIPILIGTKFDDFVRLPPDLQWTIARAYARVMKATLFFSSSVHNINVNKIFKFIAAKLFDVPWSVERNLTIGEPIVDF
ncbi:septum-promoting GTP-binding protein 1-like isoform X2 [Cucurbita moschata]|uniref:Septum-promoting GTP-binding protein 1-like isoform X2 n=1 Tax=Cucurbita moschata TaxID=3662 RepID=A0A6J1FNA0_CUCMO|nr:septum-promoting GTP-binding protein 1-like isoform X2 [Cucurbita moschata]